MSSSPHNEYISSKFNLRETDLKEFPFNEIGTESEQTSSANDALLLYIKLLFCCKLKISRTWPYQQISWKKGYIDSICSMALPSSFAIFIMPVSNEI